MGKLGECRFNVVAEFERIARDERLAVTRIFFQKTLTQVRDEMLRLALENGL